MVGRRKLTFSILNATILLGVFFFFKHDTMRSITPMFRWNKPSLRKPKDAIDYGIQVSADPLHPDHKLMSKRQEKRKQHLASFCRTHPEYTTAKYAPRKTAYYFTIVDEKNKAVYCTIAKTGSTEWARILLKMSGKCKGNECDTLKSPQAFENMQRFGLYYLWSYKPHKAENFIKNFTKFLVVRNPISRFVSFYYERLSGKVFLSQFDLEEIGVNQVKPVPFDFLVKVVTGTSEFWNVHTQDYFQACSPCQIKYDYILKQETYVEDSNYVLDMLKHDEVRMPVRKYKTNLNRTSKYLEQLTPPLKNKLIEKYRHSGVAFGYNMSLV